MMLLSILAVAGTVKEASKILSQGIYTGGPTEAWANGVAMSLKAFAEGISVLQETGFMGGLFGGEGYNEKIVNVAKAMKAAAIELDGFDWDGSAHPTAAWSSGVGSAIKMFVQGIAALQDLDEGIFDSSYETKIKNLAKAIKAAAIELSDYDWNKNNKYPSLEWTEAVGAVLSNFVKYLIEIEKNDIGRGDLRMLRKTIDSMISTSEKFADVDVWAAPPMAWGENVEKSISAIARAIKELEGVDDLDLLEDVADSMIYFTKKLEKVLKNKELYIKGGVFDSFSDSMKRLAESLPKTSSMAESLNDLGSALMKISSMGAGTTEAIRGLTASIVEMSDSLKGVDMESIDKLSKFSNGILVLSLIDEKKFEEALSVIDKKRNDIIAILSDNSTIKSRPNVAGAITLEESAAAESETSNREKFYEELLSKVSNLDSNVGAILEIQKNPSESVAEDTKRTGGATKVNGDQTNRTHD
jgi:hypothetical protein